MIDDSDKDDVRAFIARVIEEFKGDIQLVSHAIQAEYGKQPEHLRFALRYAERTQQREEPRLPKPKGPVWVRFEKEDDESGRFTDIEELKDKGGGGTRCFRVKSKHGYVTMFLKYLHGSQATQREIDIARALREYRSYNILRHPNIVEVYDAAWVRTDKDEFPFVATEFLDGVNLMEWREKHQTAPTPHQSGEIIRIIAATLQSLLDVDKGKVREVFGPTDRAEVMHLDLKPNNVMVLYRISLELRVGELMDALFLESVSHAQRWEAAQAVNNVLELESPQEITEQGVKTRKPFGDKLIAGIQGHVAFKPKKFVEFLAAVQEQQVGLPANNPLRTFMIQRREGEKITIVDQTNLKLIDFGSGGPAEAATALSSAKTNEHYKAPERFHSEGKRPTPTKAWDIYSLGAILYYLSTGKHLESPERHTKASWHQYLSHIDLNDPDLTLIFRKCLAYEPTDRFSSPGQLEESLSDWLDNRPIRHIGRTYTWWQQESLLIHRCRNSDDEGDVAHFFSHIAIAVAAAVAITDISTFALLFAGCPVIAALNYTGIGLNSTLVVLAIALAFVIRFRFSTLRFLVPFGFVVVACSVMNWCLNAASMGNPTREESNATFILVLPLIAMLNVCVGMTEKRAHLTHAIGWLILLASPFVKQILSHDAYADYSFAILDVCEIAACIALASRGFAIAKSRTAQNNTHRKAVGGNAAA